MLRCTTGRRSLHVSLSALREALSPFKTMQVSLFIPQFLINALEKEIMNDSRTTFCSDSTDKKTSSWWPLATSDFGRYNYSGDSPHCGERLLRRMWEPGDLPIDE